MEQIDILIDWLRYHPLVQATARTVTVLLIAWLSFYAARTVLLRWIARLIRKTRTKFDDVLLEHGVLRRVALLAPIVVLYYGADWLPGPKAYVLQVVNATLTVVVLLVVGAAINAVQEVIAGYYARAEVPVKSYTQIAKIIIYVVGTLIATAVLTGKSPWVLLSGVGALMAVVILVFRDTILSLVASFTIASNRMVRIGDWIEAPDFGADGDVVDVALHTVKVQNWDKTITSIPTHKLVEVSFKNWRGMQESGGRRIKRALHLDMNTARFCDEEMLDRFEAIELIRDYVRERRQVVDSDNAERKVNVSELVNGRRLTNVGTFRAYVVAYLRSHPRIHQDMTFLVRHRAPTPQGLPLEIYVFTTTTVWGEYEGIQSDIFDHLLAAVPRFGLKVFQEPTGAELAQALSA